MIWASVTVRWIAMSWHQYLRLEDRGTRERSIEVLYLKPQKDTISGWQMGIANRAVMMLHIPVVQLQDEPTL